METPQSPRKLSGEGSPVLAEVKKKIYIDLHASLLFASFLFWPLTIFIMVGVVGYWWLARKKGPKKIRRTQGRHLPPPPPPDFYRPS